LEDGLFQGQYFKMIGVHDREPGIRAFLYEKELWLIIIIGIFFFNQVIFFGKTFFFRDLYGYFFFQKTLLVDIVRSGELPLWNPYLHAGRPFLANMNNSLLYPTNLLYFILPSVPAFNLDIVLHLILCGVGTYCLARTLAFNKLASLAAAIVYQYGGITLSIPNVWLFAPAHLPFLLLFWHRYLSRPQPVWFLLAVLTGFLQVLAGRPEMPFLSLLFLGGWSVVYPYSSSKGFRLSRWALLSVFIIGVSLVQLLPMADMARDTSRATGRGFRSTFAWSLNPKRLPEILLPGFMGATDRLAIQDYWGRKIEDEGFPYILSIYFGAPTVVLAFAAFSRNSVPIPFRVKIFLVSAIALAFILAMGRYVPFLPWIYGKSPYLFWFRYPIKFILASTLPVALLVGSSVDLFDRGKHFSRGSLFFIGILSACIILPAVLFLTDSSFSRFFQMMFFDSGENVRQGLRASFYRCTLPLLMTLLVICYGYFYPKDWQSYMLVSILAIDLLPAGKQINPVTGKDFFLVKPQVVDLVRSNLGEGRLFTVEPRNVTLKAPSNDIVWQSRWNLEVLFSYYAALYRIPVVFFPDTDGLTSTSMAHLAATVNDLPWNRRLSALSSAAVTLILTPEELSIAGAQRIATITNPSDRVIYLYRNNLAAPRIGFFPDVEYVESDGEVFRELARSQVDFRRKAFIETQPAEPTSCPQNEFAIKYQDRNFNSVEYVIDVSCSGYLVFSESYYPGWRVYVDDQAQQIVKANVAFSAVRLKPGVHRVLRRYSPGAVIYGALLSGTFIVLLLCTAFVKRIHRTGSNRKSL
jgi:hypothetical protein